MLPVTNWSALLNIFASEPGTTEVALLIGIMYLSFPYGCTDDIKSFRSY